MNKGEFLAKVAEEADVSRKIAADVFTAIEDVIVDALKANDQVTITGFGTFKTAVRKARNGVNPKTGETISIPERTVPVFKLGKKLKEALKD